MPPPEVCSVTDYGNLFKSGQPRTNPRPRTPHAIRHSSSPKKTGWRRSSPARNTAPNLTNFRVSLRTSRRGVQRHTSCDGAPAIDGDHDPAHRGYRQVRPSVADRVRQPRPLCILVSFTPVGQLSVPSACRGRSPFAAIRIMLGLIRTYTTFAVCSPRKYHQTESTRQKHRWSVERLAA